MDTQGNKDRKSIKSCIIAMEDELMNKRKAVLYQVYVRNHTKEGTFQALIRDLPRIKRLGVDVIYLLPIHPISVSNRKGAQGSPYAIDDFRAVNPELGTLDDFRDLVQAVHDQHLQLMIDVVYNHTGHHSKLYQEHPEFFYLKNGKPGNKVGDWWDIIDLDFTNKALWDYLIETLEYWVHQGVDGFRCDVAPLIPLDFWKAARTKLETIKPNILMLSESVEPSFITYLRGEGFVAHSDGEMYQAFDLLYDYDVYGALKDYWLGKGSLESYLEKVRMQEYIYPAHYSKMHFLENHDQQRVFHYVKDVSKVLNWTAFTLFNKGSALIFGGQEVESDHLPDLFNKDPIEWNFSKTSVQSLLRKMINIKHNDEMTSGKRFIISKTAKEVIVCYYEYATYQVMGIFNVGGETGTLPLSIPDGIYENCLNFKPFDVSNGQYTLTKEPVIFRIYSPL